jgi:acid phosphatase
LPPFHCEQRDAIIKRRITMSAARCRLLEILIAGTFAALADCPLAAGRPPAYDHVVVIVEENHSLDQVIGSGNAPFIEQLASHGVLFTSMFAVTHPSQPNYLHLFSGSNQGVTGDRLPEGTPFDTPNLGAALLASGKTFAGYSEDLPVAGSTLEIAGAYRRRHNPWVNWQDESPGRSTYALPPSVNLPFTEFPTDPNGFSALPTVSFVIPNLDHDMHNGSVTEGDEWLRANLSAYNDWAQSNNSLLVVVWDEDNFRGTNRIPMIFSGAGLRPGRIDATYTLHNLLRTVEDMYGVAHSGVSAKAYPIQEAFAGLQLLPRTSIRFQQGEDGYVGTHDTALQLQIPEINLVDDPIITVDGDGFGPVADQPSQALIRFDGIVGFRPGQIPPNAKIVSAQLVLTTGNNGGAARSTDDMKLHRMLTPWDDSSTWTSLVDGVSTDGIEALAEADFSVEPNVVDAPAIFITTETVQRWVDGDANNGWLLTTRGSNDWTWNSSDAVMSEVRPLLEVVFLTSENPGDVDGDTVLDSADLDLLMGAIRAGSQVATFDLNADGVIDELDRDYWVHDGRNTWFGDSNLDGRFDSSDLVRVFQSAEYEDAAVGNSSWSEGDWSGDGEFDTADLVLAFRDGGFEQGPRQRVAAVPEPSALALSCAAALIAFSWSRRFDHCTTSLRPLRLNKVKVVPY